MAENEQESRQDSTAESNQQVPIIRDVLRPKRTLAFAVAVAIVYVLLDRALLDAPSWLLVSVVFVFLAFGLVWDFVEKKYGIGALAAAFVICLLLYLGALHLSQPPDREEVIDDLDLLVQEKAWTELRERLDSPDVTQFRDVFLFYRASLLSSSGETQEPERLLASIQPNDRMYWSAQWQRMFNWAIRDPSDAYGQQITDSMERVGYFMSPYYRIRVEDSRLKYDGISLLYEEFKSRHKRLFDFDSMKSASRIPEQSYTELDTREIIALPALTYLFLARMAFLAHDECRREEKVAAYERYDELIKNAGGFVELGMDLLRIRKDSKEKIESVRNQPIQCAS